LYAKPAVLHTITGQFCQLRLDHIKLHHKRAEVLTQRRRGHGAFDAAWFAMFDYSTGYGEKQTLCPY